MIFFLEEIIDTFIWYPVYRLQAMAVYHEKQNNINNLIDSLKPLKSLIIQKG